MPPDVSRPPVAPLADRLAEARALAPIVEAEAPASERATTLSPKTVAAFRDSGLLAAFLPRELDGDERPPLELARLVEELARQDGSAGWCFGMNGLITGICAAYLPDEGLARVYGAGDRADAPRRLMAGGFPPQGRADRDGDGWRVTGHFRFGSGIRHADYVACTVVEFADDAPLLDGPIPRMRTFVVPREDVRIDPEWDVAGLCGTGSCDYFLDDARLPDAMSFVSSHPTPRRGARLFGLPMLSIAAAPHIGFALGVGRRILEEVEALADRQRLGSAARLADRPAFRQGYARARTALDAARALADEALAGLAAVADRAGAGDPSRGATLEERAAVTAATVHAYETAVATADMAFRAGGGAALHRAGRLGRCHRDLIAGRQHVVASEEAWERLGQAWLGMGDPGMI